MNSVLRCGLQHSQLRLRPRHSRLQLGIGVLPEVDKPPKVQRGRGPIPLQRIELTEPLIYGREPEWVIVEEWMSPGAGGVHVSFEVRDRRVRTVRSVVRTSEVSVKRNWARRRRSIGKRIGFLEIGDRFHCVPVPESDF